MPPFKPTRTTFMYLKKYFFNPLALIFLIIGLESCFTYPMPNSLKNNFTFYYTPEKSTLHSLIDTQGYYMRMEVYERRIPLGFFSTKWKYQTDTFYMNYIFFNDGIVLVNAFGKGEVLDHKDSVYYVSSPQELPQHLSLMTKDTSKTKKLIGTWGSYIIAGDTIKMQTIHPSKSLNDGWTGWEKHFKIIDRNTLKQVYLQPLHHIPNNTTYTAEFYKNSIQGEKPILFVPVQNIPNSDNWLLNEEWFWKNTQDYIEYQNKNRD